MEPFHAITNQPGRSGVTLAWATPVISVSLMALVPTAAHAWSDSATLVAVGGFTLALFVVATCLSLKVLIREEIFIDRRAMLIRRRLGRRIWERAVQLAPDAQAHVGPDTRPKVGRGSYTAIRLRTSGGSDYLFGEGLNTRDQEDLASQLNAYFRLTGVSE